MNAATITFPIDPIVKEKAQAKVEKQGYSLELLVGSFVNELLAVVAKKDDAEIVVRLEKPTAYFNQAVKKARKDLKEGKASPTFKNAEAAIKWLRK